MFVIAIFIRQCVVLFYTRGTSLLDGSMLSAITLVYVRVNTNSNKGGGCLNPVSEEGTQFESGLDSSLNPVSEALSVPFVAVC